MTSTGSCLASHTSRVSKDEKRLFDVVARSYLASVMPDYRYRQTTVTMDVGGGHEFRATGRQALEAGWRAAFRHWRPEEEKGEAAQALPVLRDGEAARLQDPMIEDKETRAPPRYKEGTLIEAMQNAWRFVEDGALRERLREAKGIGTPATRADIISGLKRQGFLTAQGQNIVPTEQGLALFEVLGQADPALVDPGMTAEVERLLDDVLTGKQPMRGAIDAVCDTASRIIGKLTRPGVGGVTIRTEEALGASAQRPPTAAMRKFAAAIARNKGIRAPGGYTKSAAVCRAFLDRHAPGRDPGEDAGSGEGEAGAPANQGRRGEAQIVRTGPDGFRGGHAASHPLRQQGGCVEAWSEVWRGRLVRAAGRRPLRLPGAGLAVVVRNAAGAALAVATIRSGTGGARARARGA